MYHSWVYSIQWAHYSMGILFDVNIGRARKSVKEHLVWHTIFEPSCPTTVRSLCRSDNIQFKQIFKLQSFFQAQDFASSGQRMSFILWSEKSSDLHTVTHNVSRAMKQELNKTPEDNEKFKTKTYHKPWTSQCVKASFGSPVRTKRLPL